MPSSIDSFSRYFPPDPESSGWGWRLLDAGCQRIAPNAQYPERGHPSGYLFATDGKRILEEHQIVLITEGSGWFESKSVTKTKVQTGTAMLLFPGEWHRYHPDPNTGWSESWVGFRGRDAERILSDFFTPQQALHSVAQLEAMTQTFEQMLHWIRQPIAGRDQIAASHIPLALAFLRAGAQESNSSEANESVHLLKAKAVLLQNIEGRTDLEELARQLGMSYSKFRASFKQHTGYAPREFENRIKLNRSRDLLQQGKSITDTAQALGFNSVYYYSRAFKKRFGQSPQQWLKGRKKDS